MAQPVDADQTTVVVGACLMTLTLSNGVVPRVTSSATWSVSGTGSCYDNATAGTTGSINGSVTSVSPVPAGCAAGAYQGNVDVFVSTALGTRGTFARLMIGGPVLALAGDEALSFVGGGIFVNARLTPSTVLTTTAPTPETDQAQCAVSGDNTLIWTGVYTFGKPEV